MLWSSSNGASGKFAQENVGHGDYSVTFNEYAKNGRDGIDNAMVIVTRQTVWFFLTDSLIISAILYKNFSQNRSH